MGDEMKKLTISALCLLAAACAKSETIRTSNNSILVQTSAAPACGATGAVKVAAQTAAVETIRAGYDRYIIAGGAGANNVSLVQGAGSSYTTGNVTYGGGYGTYSGNTTYVPGPMMSVGSHDQNLAVQMFKDGEPGASQAISARDVLGPEWQEKVKSGIRTCTG
jgi:hypothetical protein